MPTDSKALALVTKSDGRHFSRQPQALLAKLAHYARLDKQAVQLALQIGALLWQTKAGLQHGEFQPWIKEHVVGHSYRQCARFMKLTLVFAETMKPSEAAFLALPGLDLDASVCTSDEQNIVEAMAKFAGDLSVNELLIKHGIIGVGLKGELLGGDAPPALTEQQQLELNWEQAYAPAKSLADLIAAQAARFLPEQKSALEAELTRALSALRAA